METCMVEAVKSGETEAHLSVLKEALSKFF